MTAVAGKTFGTSARSAAFPRRLAAREVRAPSAASCGAASRAAPRIWCSAARCSTRQTEADDRGALRRRGARPAGGRSARTAFLRLLGLVETCRNASTLTRQSLLDQSRLEPRAVRPAVAVRRLRARRRALLLPRPDPGEEICRADRRRRQLERDRAVGPPLRAGRLADRACRCMSAGAEAIYARARRRLQRARRPACCSTSTRADDAELEELFLAAEEAEADGRYDEAAALLPALPRHRSERLRRRLQPRQLPARSGPARRGGA